MNKKVAGYRVMAGLTQNEMAEKIGMPKTTYVYKEAGPGDFKTSELVAIKEELAKHDVVVTLEQIV